MAMEQGPMIQHQLPIHDYALPTDQDYNDQFPGHGNYATGGAGREGNNSLHGPTHFSFTPTNSTPAARFVSDRGVASDSSSYHTTSNFTDHSSSAGSISTSPSSAASSLAYTGYVGQNPCASISNFPGSVQPYVPATYANSRPGGMLPPPLTRPSPTEREAYPHSSLLGRPNQPISGNHNAYNSYTTETPRTSLFNNLSHFSNGAPIHSMASPPGYGNSDSCNSFPWPTLEIHAEMTSEGQAITPEVHAKVEKGFFLSTVDQKWTCYRRNYFSVQCHFELHPNITNGRMFLKRTNSPNTEQIQAMGMRLSAAVDGPGGKSIELVQHTPKRDNGPKNKIDITKVSPTPTSGRNDHTVSPHGMYQQPMSTFHATGQVPGPFLPMQNTSDPNASPSSSSAPALAAPYPYSTSAGSHVQLPGQNTSHTFERVQFKQATANNGKRRASQQYFHLIVELFADVRKDNNDASSWVKVAHRVSEKIVVRGRSPSHYQNEGQHQNSGRTGSSGGCSGYSTGAGAGYGGLASGGFRTSGSGFGGGMSGGTYRANAYAGFQHSPDNSGSSASSVDGGAAEADYQPDAVMSEAERSEMQGHDGYRYYPGPIYEGIPPHAGLPLPKIESTARYSTDPSQWAVKHEYHEPVTAAPWPVSSITRFQGVDTSRGYFPDLASNNYS